MSRKSLFFLGGYHLILVAMNIFIFDYQQTHDAGRYIHVANEFLALKFNSLDPYLNCNTAPGYPIFLALTKLITWHNKYLVAIAQSVIYIASLHFLLSTLVREKYIKANLQFWIFLIVLSCPEVFHSNSETLTESLSASCIFIIVGNLICLPNGKAEKFLMVLALTTLILTKYEYLLIVPFVLGYLTIKKRQSLSIICLITLVGTLTINGIRNYTTFNTFNPFSFSSGSVIYAGNNTNGDGSWHSPAITKGYIPVTYQSEYARIKKLDASCSCLEENKLYKKMAIEAWKEDLSFQLGVIPIKFLKLWLIPGSMDFYTSQSEIKTGLQLSHLFDDNIWPWYGKYKHGLYLMVHWIFLLSVTVGFYLKIKIYGFGKTDLIIVFLFALVCFMYSVPFYALGRFRMPIFGLLLIYSVFPLEQFASRLIKHEL